LLRSVNVTIRTADSSVTIVDSVLQVNMDKKQWILSVPCGLISCTATAPPHAEPPFVKFNVTIQAGGSINTGGLIVPVSFKVPYFTPLQIDDGIVIRNNAFGKGNANGEANAGELVVVYHGNHRLRLYCEDPYVIRSNERLTDEIIPARWPDG
jgi:hypothetical protein